MTLAPADRPKQFVSYPKSGRTWLRYILAQLKLDEHIGFHHDTFEFSDNIRTPHDFDLARRLEHYSSVDKLVYLERDPRDVMVSLYYQVTGRMQDVYDYKGNISEFLRDTYFGADNLRRFRELWAAVVSRLGFHRLTYEECHQNLPRAIGRLLSYYELDADAESLSLAIVNADFAKMQHVERTGDFPEPWLRPRNGAVKVRRGKVGGYRDMLSDDDIAYLNAIFGDPLDA